MQELKEFREKIDQIDLQLIRLLKDRMDIVKEVSKVKHKIIPEGNSFIMQAREADMIKDLLQMDIGNFPKESIVQIWRILISTSLFVERKYKIGVVGKNALINAKDYFCTLIKVEEYTGKKDIFNALNTNIIDVAILDEKTEWWHELDEKIKVFAKLPFTTNNDNKNCYALAKLENQLTYHPYSIYKIDKDIKLGKEIDNYQDKKLIEIEGFILPEHELVHQYIQDKKAQFLGTFSSQIRI